MRFRPRWKRAPWCRLSLPVALALAVGIAATLIVASGRYAEEQARHAASQAVAEVARILMGVAGGLVRERLAAGAHPGARAVDTSGALDRVLVAVISGTGVRKVKIYSDSGEVVYASDELGKPARQVANNAVAAALRGRVVGEYTRKGRINDSDGVIEERDMLEVYVPLNDGAGRVIGVFEVYWAPTRGLPFAGAAQAAVSLLIVLTAIGVGVWLGSASWRRQQGRESQQRPAADDAGRDGEDRSPQQQDARQSLVTALLDAFRAPVRVVSGDYDVVHANASARRLADAEVRAGGKCYASLYGRDAPCDAESGTPCPYQDVLHADAPISVVHSLPGLAPMVVDMYPVRGGEGDIVAVVEVLAEAGAERRR